MTATAANKKLVVAVIGYTGGVGSCLLTAMKKVGLPPYALVRSSTMKVGYDSSSEVPVDYGALGASLLQEGGIPVIADVTASGEVQDHYEGWLNKGISVVAANKGIFAGSESNYQALLTAAKKGNCRLLHETTVGAGTYEVEAQSRICGRDCMYSWDAHYQSSFEFVMTLDDFVHANYRSGNFHGID